MKSSTQYKSSTLHSKPSNTGPMINFHSFTKIHTICCYLPYTFWSTNAADIKIVMKGTSWPFPPSSSELAFAEFQLNPSGWKWSDLVVSHRTLAEMAPEARLNLSGGNWSALVRYGRHWSALVENSLKWSDFGWNHDPHFAEANPWEPMMIWNKFWLKSFLKERFNSFNVWYHTG